MLKSFKHSESIWNFDACPQKSLNEWMIIWCLRTSKPKGLLQYCEKFSKYGWDLYWRRLVVGWVGGGSALATDPPPATHLSRIQDTRNMLHLRRMDSGFQCWGSPPLFAMVDRSVRGLRKPAKGQPFWEGSPLLISYIFASDASGEVERYEVARLLLLPLLWPAADTALPTHLHSRQWTLGRDQSWKRTFAKFLLSTRRRS